MVHGPASTSVLPGKSLVKIRLETERVWLTTSFVYNFARVLLFQFKDIRERLDIDGNFKPWGAVQYIFKDYEPEAIESKGPYPLNLLSIIHDSPNLKLSNAIKSTLALPDLVYFNYETIWDKYDDITLPEWAAEKVHSMFGMHK